MKRYITLLLCLLLGLCLASCALKNTTNSVDEYLETNVPLAYSELLIFPQKQALESCTVNDYRGFSARTLLFDDVYFLLRCTYTLQQYEQEIERLKEVGAEYCEDLFPFPAYVMLFYGNYYEYALLDGENSEIIYVYAETADFDANSPEDMLLEGFPEEYRPTALPSDEIVKYTYDE